MTEFTVDEPEVATLAYALSQEGKGVVLGPHLLSAAHRLLELGWLTYEIEDGGDVSWWWSPAGDTAFAFADVSEVCLLDRPQA